MADLGKNVYRRVLALFCTSLFRRNKKDAQRRSNAITDCRNKTIENRECSVVTDRSSGSVTDRRNKTIENRK